MSKFQSHPADDGYVCRRMDPADGVEIEGVEIENPIWGGTLEKDGVPVAYAGVNLIAGRHWVYFYIKDDNVRTYGLWIVRLIRDSMKMCEENGITTLYGLCDTTKPNARQFMTALGFRPVSALDKSSDIILYERLMANPEMDQWPRTWRWQAQGN